MDNEYMNYTPGVPEMPVAPEASSAPTAPADYVVPAGVEYPIYPEGPETPVYYEAPVAPEVPEEDDSLFSDDVVRALLIIVGIIGIFVLGYNLLTPKEGVTDVADTQISYNQTVAATQATAAPVVTTTAPQNSATNQSTVATTLPAGATQSQMSTSEIIAIFNESANKVKTDAVTVVKNFEHRTHNEEKLVLPSLLEGMFADVMAKNLSDDTEPIPYATKEEIIIGYPVPGETWSSQLTEAEVAEAACVDTGTEYEIMLKLHPTLNPEPGIGTAKAFDCITASEVAASAPPMIKEFSAEYYDCVVKCRVDKATGRTVWSNYTSPVVIKVLIDMGFTQVDAQIGLTFEKDYTITY